MSLGEFTLLDPWFLAAIPLAWVAWWWAARGRAAALPAASTRTIEGLPRTLRQRLQALPTLLTVLAASAVALALARPVTRDVLPIQSQGRDILLVFDVSSSMNYDDVGPVGSRQRRVEAARDRALDFALGRDADRVGLLTFACFPDLRCPPTLDEESLAAFIRPVDTVEPNSAEDGTAIGAALARAVEVLAEDPVDGGEADGGSRVVILLSDGEETEGVIPPEAGAKLAHDAGIRVHTIGFGQGQPTGFGGIRELRFEALREIAEITEGRFFRARTSADLAEVYAEIDRLETTELEDPRYRTTDWFERPLLAAGALLALALLLELGWIRRSPA